MGSVGRAEGTKSSSSVFGSARSAWSTSLRTSQKVWLPSADTRSSGGLTSPAVQRNGSANAPRRSTSESGPASPQARLPTTASSTTQGRSACHAASRR